MIVLQKSSKILTTNFGLVKQASIAGVNWQQGKRKLHMEKFELLQGFRQL